MAPYVVLNVLVMLAVVLVAANNGVRWGKPLAAALAALLLLTLIFDNIMIDQGIMVYNVAQVQGFKLWLAPIEDFAYAVVAVLLAACLWKVSGKRR